MAASLSAVPVRHTGKQSLYTGLPAIPNATAAPATADHYPASTITGLSSTVSSTTLTPTWIAQAHVGGVKVCIAQGAGSTASGYVVDPTSVDWPNVTRTYQRPRNPNGGIPRWSEPRGTATLRGTSPVFPFAIFVISTQALVEDRQLLLSGLNTWTEARKLPPLTPVSLTSPSADNIYASGTIGAIQDVGITSPGKAVRWLGGKLAVTAFVPTISITVNVWLVPITAGLDDNINVTGVIIGTITTTIGVPTTRIFTVAEILTATGVRWDQFWLVVNHPGGAPPTSTASYALYAPTDVPPPYDCPGADSFIPGGFL